MDLTSLLEKIYRYCRYTDQGSKFADFGEELTLFGLWEFLFCFLTSLKGVANILTSKKHIDPLSLFKKYFNYKPCIFVNIFVK